MEVSTNAGTPKSSILVGFFIINWQFWGSQLYIWGVLINGGTTKSSIYFSKIFRYKPTISSILVRFSIINQTFCRSPLYVDIYIGVSIHGGYPNSWMVYEGKSYQQWWFGGTPILGTHHIYIHTYIHIYILLLILIEIWDIFICTYKGYPWIILCLEEILRQLIGVKHPFICRVYNMFQPSKAVQDFFHPQYHGDIIG